MAGNRLGGLKAAQKVKERHGDDFYVKIGAIGGAKSGKGGFYWATRNVSEDDPRHPRHAGKIGGATSKRKKANA